VAAAGIRRAVLATSVPQCLVVPTALWVSADAVDAVKVAILAVKEAPKFVATTQEGYTATVCGASLVCPQTGTGLASLEIRALFADIATAVVIGEAVLSARAVWDKLAIEVWSAAAVAIAGQLAWCAGACDALKFF